MGGGDLVYISLRVYEVYEFMKENHCMTQMIGIMIKRKMKVHHRLGPRGTRHWVARHSVAKEQGRKALGRTIPFWTGFSN